MNLEGLECKWAAPASCRSRSDGRSFGPIPGHRMKRAFFWFGGASLSQYSRSELYLP